MKPPKPVILLGSGMFAYTVADTFLSLPQCPVEIAGFAQNLDPSKRDESFEGFRVFSLEELAPLASTHEAICVLGNCAAKRRFVEQASDMGFEFATLIHPQTFLSRRTALDAGIFTGLFTIIAAHCRIGRHCFFCNHSQVGEECVLGDYVYVGPGAQIAGGSRIGSEVFIGVNASISDHVTIGDGATVGAGAVVVRDVVPGATVVGNPAREIPPKATGSGTGA